MHIMAIAYILVVPVWSKLPVLSVSESVLSVFSVPSAVYINGVSMKILCVAILSYHYTNLTFVRACVRA